MSNKIAVIYKTKYGSTKKYSGWIALNLDADLYEVSDIRSKHLKEYDIIIFGGGLYRGKINGINFIDDNFEKLENKEVYIFTVGMENINEDRKSKIIENNLKNIKLNKSRLYNFKGEFEYKNLNFIDKILMKGLKSVIEKKGIKNLTEEDKYILEGFNNKVDLSNKKSIKILIEDINKCQKC
ncbi:flavodoxin [[Clostridium] sordellii]|uniref:flavodoxin domain-containing protein n=1 Tax=Paraclostridium sordellii TaxID=1505 RepID=UPI0005E0969E|nr:flavodoxin domain-containing protein [Paeniclostridium sordellii]CEQ09973.1 flavodoxin [[Clostridium] sordellii] [Paeniclostridium sordellii]